MRTLFIGSTKRGYLALKALVQAEAELSGIISLRQEAHEAERFEEPIRDLAEMLGVPCFETHLMTDRDYAALIREVIRPEIAFVVGCRILLPKEIY